MNKKLGVGLISAVIAVGLAGCATKDNSTAQVQNKVQDKKIVFATAPDTQPFTYIQNGNLAGFDIDIVNAIAKKEHYDIQWKQMKFDGIIPALQSKSIDGATAAITIRDDRKKVTDFTDPYYDSGLVLAVNKKSGIQKLQDLKGKTIVAKQGSSGLVEANKLAQQYGAKVKILEDEPTLYMDVQNGGADALVNDLPFVMAKVNSGTASFLKVFDQKLTTEEYGIAISKNDPEVLKAFNKDLAKMKSDGEYDTIYAKYFGKRQ